ncbi:Asp-tRNA(Asn)/Glu-tRNA(Gln) amidotransferase subunit GatC [Peptococcaceae bacterium]|nr:Asp-tRNA(Asn)/Glu-tRNA(Gln) amidotransferase subunit GatC [Peptococcaceae bacterium]
MISEREIEYIANLSKLKLDERGKEMYAEQLNKILQYAKKLQNLNTDNIEPTAHVLPVKNVFRDDVVGQHMPNDRAISNVPDFEGNYIKVPKISC